MQTVSTSSWHILLHCLSFTILTLALHCHSDQLVNGELLFIVVIIETLWDPLSSKQTERLTRVVQHLVDDYPTVHADNKNTQVSFVGETC